MITPEEINKDIQAIIDYCHSFAEKLLSNYKEYYPFGAEISNEGELKPVGYEDKETDKPKSQKVIDELTTYFENRIKEKNIRAFGLAYDVRVKINDKGDKSDAILIDIVHQDALGLPKYCFTYSWSEDGELVFGESFGMNQ